MISRCDPYAILICPSDGTTALHYAVFCANDDLVKALVMNGADVNLCDSDGRNVLHWATASSSFRTFELVLDKVCVV